MNRLSPHLALHIRCVRSSPCLESNSSDDEQSVDRDDKHKRTRTNFTSAQIDQLEKAFHESSCSRSSLARGKHPSVSFRSLSGCVRSRGLGNEIGLDRVPNTSLVSKSTSESRRPFFALSSGNVTRRFLFQWRKMENTKKGPGRPPSNAHPITCSGQPLSYEELEKKRLRADEKKRRKEKKTTTTTCQSLTADSNSSSSLSSTSTKLDKSSYSIDRILSQTNKKNSL